MAVVDANLVLKMIHLDQKNADLVFFMILTLFLMAKEVANAVQISLWIHKEQKSVNPALISIDTLNLMDKEDANARSNLDLLMEHVKDAHYLELTLLETD